jgi:molybdate transport system permease protein
MNGIWFDGAVALLCAVFASLVLLPIGALFSSTSVIELFRQFASLQALFAVLLSLKTSLAVVFLALCIGIPVAYALSMKSFRGKVVLDTLVDLPISTPPLVAGLALLILLGRSNSVGLLLSDLGVELLFTQKGIVLAQLFVATPFLIKSSREAFDAIDRNVIQAARVLGASSLQTFIRVMLPLAKNGIYAGMVMTWARAMGEFGATSMVAGCVPSRTETMTVAVYQHALAGEMSASIAVALLLAVFSFTLLLVFKTRTKRQIVAV